jgi:CubicO group peptidase (beta-lactamase class C family)
LLVRVLFEDVMASHQWRFVARLGFATALVVVFSACQREAPEANPGSLPRVFPDAEWKTASPDDAGLDRRALDKFAEIIGGDGVVISHGFLIHRWGAFDHPAMAAAVGKPIIVHFLFHAIETGRINHLDDKVAVFEPRLKTLDRMTAGHVSRITWRHLANQTSCYGVSERPGDAFDHSDYQTALFWSLLFEKVYRADVKTSNSILREQLFDLIGAQDHPRFEAGDALRADGRLVISARDLARFGLLYLRGGQWNDRQIIAKKWVTVALSSPLPLTLPRTHGLDAEMIAGQRTYGGPKNQEDHLGCYSFMWWLNQMDPGGQRLWPELPADAFGSIGHGGRDALIIAPSRDLIVAWLGSKLTPSSLNMEARTHLNNALKTLISAKK